MARDTQDPQIRTHLPMQRVSFLHTRLRRKIGVVLATVLYFLVGGFILFWAAAIVDAEESSNKRVHAEITPSFGLMAGFNSVKTGEPPRMLKEVADSSEKTDESLKSASGVSGDVGKAPSPLASDLKTPDAPSLAKLDSSPKDDGDRSEELSADDHVKNRIVQLAKEIERSQKIVMLETTLEITSKDRQDQTDSTKEDQTEWFETEEEQNDKVSSPTVTDVSLEKEIEREESEQTASEAETQEESEPAFAYSNPSLSAPSTPNSDFSALGLTKLYSETNDQESLKQFQPVPIAMPTVASAPATASSVTARIAASAAVSNNAIQNPNVPFQTVESQYATSNVNAKPYASQYAPNAVVQQNWNIQAANPTVLPSVAQTPKAYRVSQPQPPVLSQPNRMVEDNFHAKKPRSFNGMTEGKTYRTFDENAFNKGGEYMVQPTFKGPVSTRTRSPWGRDRFSSNERQIGKNAIVQVSAIVRGNDSGDYEEDGQEDESMPLIAWREENRKKREAERNLSASVVFASDDVEVPESNDEEEKEEEVVVEEEEILEAPAPSLNTEEEKTGDGESETVEIEQEREYVEQTSDKTSKSEIVSKKTDGTSALERKNKVVSEASETAKADMPGDSVQKETETDDESEGGRLFPNIRPFKKIRERRLHKQEAPKPPVVEKLAPETRVDVELAKEPLLTRESSKLPPLSVEPNESYSQEIAENALATKNDLAAIREEMKGFSWTKGSVKITPYGFINLSLSSDSQRAVPGDYILYVQSKDVDDSSGFTIDARTSRLGLNVEAGRVEALNSDLKGTVEFDFQGYPNGSKNKGGVQFRRAFAELVDKQHDRRLLVGQEWEVISPGAPQMLNYLPAGFAGDLQYRRGQVRFEQGYSTSSDLRFLTQIAACDNVLGDYVSTQGVSPASSGWPIIEGRVSAEMFKDMLCGRPIVVGLSGHIGEQYYKFSPINGVPMCATTERNAIRTWSANIDFSTPLGNCHSLQGEYFVGSNLSSFIGGINQGVDLYTREGIDDKGGWISLHSDWTKKAATNIGYGFDKPERGDLIGTSVASNGITTARTKNEVYFINCLYNWTPNLMTGVELSYWRTDYQKANVSGTTPTFSSMRSGKDLRAEFTTRFSF